MKLPHRHILYTGLPTAGSEELSLLSPLLEPFCPSRIISINGGRTTPRHSCGLYWYCFPLRQFRFVSAQLIKQKLTPILTKSAGFAYVFPELRYAFQIVNLTTDFAPYAAPLAAFDASCSLEHRGLLVGCEDLHLVGNSIYTACEPGLPLHNRNKWGRDKTLPVEHIKGDKLFRWDLDTDSVVELQLQNMPSTDADNAAERSFLGLDVNERPDGTLSLYVINLMKSGNVIDKFHHDPSTDFVKHVKRIETTHPDAAWAPDDVFALPEHDDDDAVFVTCDHGTKGHFMQQVEYFARQPWSWVSFYSKSTDWKIALPKVVSANGIIGDKAIENRRIYVSEVVGGTIRITKHSETEYGKLETLETVAIAGAGDNPTISPDGKDIYITGSARTYLLKPYMTDISPEFVDRGNPEKPPVKGPGSFIRRFSADRNIQGKREVETLMLDGYGEVANFTTTALLVPASEDTKVGGGKGDLYLTGLKFDGVLKCKNFG